MSKAVYKLLTSCQLKCLLSFLFLSVYTSVVIFLLVKFEKITEVAQQLLQPLIINEIKNNDIII